MTRDFSIREEIKIALKEGGVDDSKIDLNIDEIYDGVEADELMINMIELSIYETIKEKLVENDKHMETVDYKINETRKSIVAGLMSRGII